MSGLQRQSRFERGDDVVVMKFEGTSVEDAAAIRRLIGIVKSRNRFAAGGRGQCARKRHRPIARSWKLRQPGAISGRPSPACAK